MRACFRDCSWAALLLLSAVPARADPDALWKIVGGQCVPHEQEAHDPAPCAEVDPGGFAVLKDNSPQKPTHFLLIPTARVTGIEDPVILQPDAPNYWQEAWKAQRFVDALVHRDLPREEIGLAINSEGGRTQNQLHIHIDCIDPDVIAALHRQEAAIGTNWTPLSETLRGHPYQATRISGNDLSSVRPFLLLADGVPGAPQHMGEQTLVAVGAVFADGSPGFFLLTDRADPASGDHASGEELLRTCPASASQ